MKIKSVRARVYEWQGKTVPPQGNFCSNAMDLLYAPQETMSTFRFHSWTVVEVETDEGIVGLGNIGVQIARRAQAFDMEILYTNRKPRADAPAGYTYCPNIEALAAQCDFLVLAVPGGGATRHMVNAQVLDALGPNGWLINIARGTVVDEAALVAMPRMAAPCSRSSAAGSWASHRRWTR